MSYRSAEHIEGRGGPCKELITVTRSTRFFSVAAVLALGAGLGACQELSTTNNRGLSSNLPDEFRVVARAPLVIPPDFGLRPPMPGEPRPQELQPERTARAALVGPESARGASDGEKILMTKAGVADSNPSIKLVVDDEFGDLAYKEKTFADRVMFWRKEDNSPAAVATEAAVAGETPRPIDASAEARRIAGLTGNQPIIIQRNQPEPERRRFKLPGL